MILFVFTAVFDSSFIAKELPPEVGRDRRNAPMEPTTLTPPIPSASADFSE